MRRFLLACVASLIMCGAASADEPAGKASYKIQYPGNIVVDLGSGIGVVGFEAGGLLRFNESATGMLGSMAPAQKDANILAYFSATGLQSGYYSIPGIFTGGPQDPYDPSVNEPTNRWIDAVYTPIGEPSVMLPRVYLNSIVPEPSTIALASTALIAIAALRRRHR